MNRVILSKSALVTIYLYSINIFIDIPIFSTSNKMTIHRRVVTFLFNSSIPFLTSLFNHYCSTLFAYKQLCECYQSRGPSLAAVAQAMTVCRTFTKYSRSDKRRATACRSSASGVTLVRNLAKWINVSYSAIHGFVLKYTRSALLATSSTTP